MSLCRTQPRVAKEVVVVPLNVLTLIAIDPQSPSVLVLEPVEEHVSPGKSRVVPIQLGIFEAMSLGAALEHVRFPRPSTHDLMLDAFTNMDATVDHVLINKVKGKTFYARLTLAQHGRLIDLDARPSDAISLAVRQDAPVYIEEDVLEQASFPYLFREPLNEEQIVNDFKDFLENLDPEDFLE